jgi:hypothetical protein
VKIRSCMVEILIAVIAATVLLSMAGFLDPGYWNGPSPSDRAKTGTSQGRLSAVAMQTTQDAQVRASCVIDTERGGFEPPVRV